MVLSAQTVGLQVTLHRVVAGQVASVLMVEVALVREPLERLSETMVLERVAAMVENLLEQVVWASLLIRVQAVLCLNSKVWVLEDSTSMAEEAQEVARGPRLKVAMELAVEVSLMNQ